jgi:hypothetical protein
VPDFLTKVELGLVLLRSKVELVLVLVLLGSKVEPQMLLGSKVKLELVLGLVLGLKLLVSKMELELVQVPSYLLFPFLTSVPFWLLLGKGSHHQLWATMLEPGVSLHLQCQLWASRQVLLEHLPLAPTQ